jgi:Flp pilus assembly protein TadG
MLELDHGSSNRGFPVMILRSLNIANDRAGVAALEFALVAPILMMLAVGIAKFGLVMNNYLILTEAVADGARIFALERGDPDTDPYSDAVGQVQSTASNLTTASLTITLSVNGTACTTDATCNTALSTAQGQPATVKATYPCDLVVFGVNFAPSCTLSSSTTEMVE